MAVKAKREAIKHQIVHEQMHRLSTGVVLFHHAVADYLGLGPGDHQCLDLLRERGAVGGSELAAITGLTSGAITGIVSRLERAGFIRREPSDHDGRKQDLHLVESRMGEVRAVFEPIREELSAKLERFDAHQLDGINEFLEATTSLAYRHASALRGETLLTGRKHRKAGTE